MHMVDALPILLISGTFLAIGIYLMYEIIRARMAE